MCVYIYTYTDILIFFTKITFFTPLTIQYAIYDTGIYMKFFCSFLLTHLTVPDAIQILRNVFINSKDSIC